jgi:hypothetical protein
MKTDYTNKKNNLNHSDSDYFFYQLRVLCFDIADRASPASST